MNIDLAEEVQEGIKEAKRGNTQLGLQLLQDSACFNNVPEAKAWFGYCLAYEKKDFRTGITLCREVIQQHPGLAESYLALDGFTCTAETASRRSTFSNRA